MGEQATEGGSNLWKSGNPQELLLLRSRSYLLTSCLLQLQAGVGAGAAGPRQRGPHYADALGWCHRTLRPPSLGMCLCLWGATSCPQLPIPPTSRPMVFPLRSASGDRLEKAFLPWSSRSPSQPSLRGGGEKGLPLPLQSTSSEPHLRNTTCTSDLVEAMRTAVFYTHVMSWIAIHLTKNAPL